MKQHTLFKFTLFISALLFLALLVMSSSSPVAAQDPPEDISIQAIVSRSFIYQGQLSDAGGPVNGTCDFTFTLFDADTGGSQVGSPVNANGVTVTNGSFAVELDFGDDIFTGDARYLEVTVNCGSGSTTLSPREELNAVPYALGLRPGAKIEGTGTALSVTTSGSGSMAISGSATGATNPAGVYGTSASSGGRGVFGEATNTTGSNSGVRGVTRSNNSLATGVYGLAIETNAQGTGVKGQNNGTTGYGIWGTGMANATGVLGETGSSSKWGVWALNTGTGVALRAESVSGNIIEGWDFDDPVSPKFKVQNDGNVRADGTFASPAADFAEMLPAEQGLEPGDVLVIGPEGELTLSTEAYQSTVVGVYSTKPAFLGGADDDLTGQVPLAVVGIVPVKASAENGGIQPGDLLVASDMPGYAMRAGVNAPNGTVIGKALAGLEAGTDVIQMLVMLQ